ncbi:phosphate/phosphite/phosphonate ABC transporter substrate-binding protein [Streptomyces carpinensis]|uniref:Phosphate/phosphite/phosphonate ABC transporter substrate-binding protein n=1 Tax=Streptomyces carpinensis TaxID=66369 RepID=A0ABV1VV09_9ACTN|nr:phosphate/phosphite/phosphonate ABC transporter substrate-binding protein [Streptomyces carpinensis]
MFGRSTVALATLVATGSLFLVGCGSSSTPAASAANKAHPAWPSTITIGAIPSENATALQASLKPIEDLIKQKLDINVKVFSGTSYSALIEAQKAHKVDLVEYGPLSYYIAKHTGAGVENIGILTQSATDDGSYHSIAWANSKQTDVKSVADFKGKKTCFVDPASTSGYLFPSYGLLKAGLDPKKDVSPVFAGAHDASIESIAKGTCEVGFSEDIIAPQLEKAGKLKASDVRQVWQSPTIPGSPIAVSTSLPKDLRDQLKKVLTTDGNVDQLTKLGICSGATACQDTLGMWGFKDPSVADYSVIDEVCAETKSTSCTNAG